MKNAVKICLFCCLVTIMMEGCMPVQSQKAPCDQYAIGCGQKIKINQW